MRDYSKEVREFSKTSDIQEIPIEPKEESEWFSNIFTNYLLPTLFL